MPKYLAFFYTRRVLIEAPTLYEAKVKAVAEFKAPKSKQGLVAVVLVEKEGVSVLTSTSSI